MFAEDFWGIRVGARLGSVAPKPPPDQINCEWQSFASPRVAYLDRSWGSGMITPYPIDPYPIDPYPPYEAKQPLPATNHPLCRGFGGGTHPPMGVWGQRPQRLPLNRSNQKL
jgi:hypothetical protein